MLRVFQVFPGPGPWPDTALSWRDADGPPQLANSSAERTTNRGPSVGTPSAEIARRAWRRTPMTGSTEQPDPRQPSFAPPMSSSPMSSTPPLSTDVNRSRPIRPAVSRRTRSEYPPASPPIVTEHSCLRPRDQPSSHPLHLTSGAHIPIAVISATRRKARRRLFARLAARVWDGPRGELRRTDHRLARKCGHSRGHPVGTGNVVVMMMMMTTTTTTTKRAQALPLSAGRRCGGGPPATAVRDAEQRRRREWPLGGGRRPAAVRTD